ncbi:Clathrin heavy chain [Parelaphostrongylus tenuis]|uniref:Clathrin heavy chain n=1 Tax=Parelaphostrongylus tenuis TaxID=148309 RepID=A0AAD5NBG5_PARTN|nr:Clathrin heavy chain [Parelaphostrongylus tenuis]
MALLPIKFHEHLQLTNVGIRPTEYLFRQCHYGIGQIHCHRRFSASCNYRSRRPTNPQRRPISADSVIMHPTAKIIALKSGKTLQIFNIELKAKVKAHQNSEDIIFWKWINEKTIALVSETAVYHWSIEGETAPVKMFDPASVSFRKPNNKLSS